MSEKISGCITTAWEATSGWVASVAGHSQLMIGIGTLILACCTLWLAYATSQLVKEVRISRRAETEWRDRDGHINGIQPFLGVYAEKGKAYLENGQTVFRGKAGLFLEINWFGVAYTDPEIKTTYVGGMIQVEEHQLEFSVQGEDGSSPLIVTLIREGSVFPAWHYSLGIKEEDYEEYRLVVRTSRSGEEPVKDVRLAKIREGGWKASQRSRSGVGSPLMPMGKPIPYNPGHRGDDG